MKIESLAWLSLWRADSNNALHGSSRRLPARNTWTSVSGHVDGCAEFVKKREHNFTFGWLIPPRPGWNQGFTERLLHQIDICTDTYCGTSHSTRSHHLFLTLVTITTFTKGHNYGYLAASALQTYKDYFDVVFFNPTSDLSSISDMS